QTGWDPKKTCASAALCDAPAGTCHDPACAAGDLRCEKSDRQKCKADLTGWEKITTCDSEALCTPTECLTCAPLSKHCNGAIPETCNAAGTAWIADAACSTPNTCGGGGK